MWLSDLRIVQHDRVIERGAVRIDNGMIAEICEEPVAGGIAGDGLALMPGFIDMHGDMIERGGNRFPRVGSSLGGRWRCHRLCCCFLHHRRCRW